MAASYDANTGKLKLYQEPCVTPTNGGLGMSLLHPADETTSYVESLSNLKPRENDAPFLMAASSLNDRSGRDIFKEDILKKHLLQSSFQNKHKLIMEK